MSCDCCGQRGTLWCVDGQWICLSCKEASVKSHERRKYVEQVNNQIIKVDAYADMSDVTSISIFDANKEERVLYFDGGFRIKMAIMTDGKDVVFQLTKVTSSEETADLWEKLVKEALPRNWSVIGVDQQCQFESKLVRIVPTSKSPSKPYNQVVESKIGNIKRRIYANIDRIRKMNIDEAIDFIYELADIQYNNKMRM